ncbi:sigma-54 interaction domain-containing protein [Sporolituus thermophilus]|uniref:Transcriptional regulator containing PAS, AAA-type ATPase, and DNA-binding Fis domains n=1 Tax=Sporolituus thermophilus DSM 23256 TaxID=1123285 RepID=A0A1G7HTF6_9FIRM|nr:sigma 54-interacting transcriptional regulator [Sporolituus thermophilus]SDF03771.1 Transcriptional regulator containing PAS, AAA-type ATPase, and DNA-binding Fis domains [Sporolituus thermophilus DSM 23256]
MKSNDMAGKNQQSPEMTVHWFLSILDAIYDGVLVADEFSIVRYINPEYTRITGVTYDQIIGKPLHEVRPGAILPQVIRSGKPLAGVYRREGDIEYVVDMAPIFIDGKIVGGVSVVKDITEVQRLSQELQKFAKRTKRLKNMVDRIYRAKYTFGDILGDSAELRAVISVAERIAQYDSDVLITGESGTGKEVFAQAIHNASPRASGPFVAVNCAALTPSLVESELFGYEDGAFTGAKKGGKVGLFEIADGGTILLDEIAEISLEVQAKLLRVLQERSIRRVGETAEIPLNVRVIAATNKDLAICVQEGRFREDLYYRLNVLNLQLPALRERISDVKILANYFLNLYSAKIGRTLVLHPETYDALMRYHWPGNVRELRNAIEFAANMCENTVIMPNHLPKVLLGNSQPLNGAGGTLVEIVREAERRTIETMLQRFGETVEGKRRIAEILGISLATLYNKMKTLGITERAEQ